MRRECRERFPRHLLQRKPRVSNPDMHHGTCVTHVPWCISRSLTHGGGENVRGIPGACATRNVTYLVRGPCYVRTLSHNHLYTDLVTYIERTPWKILEACVKYLLGIFCRKYMWDVISSLGYSIYILCDMQGYLFQTGPFKFRCPEDVSVTHLIIMKLEVSTFAIVVMVPWLCIWGGCTLT